MIVNECEGAILFTGSLLHKGSKTEIKWETETESDKRMCDDIASRRTHK